MQIFRPFKDHTESARYLDDRRLNKQISECYQIITSCLKQKGLMLGKPGGYITLS